MRQLTGGRQKIQADTDNRLRAAPVGRELDKNPGQLGVALSVTPQDIIRPLQANPLRAKAFQPAAQALVGRTIGSSGYAEPDRLIFDANDEGTSCWFELTEDQAADVVATLSRSGHASTLLVRAAR